MSNERLRAAITAAGMTSQLLSERVGVDPKTVERWITTDRVPHRGHRMKTAAALGKTDGFLWPATESDKIIRSATQAEFVGLYPSRRSVPPQTWSQLIQQATDSIDLLAYAASFLHDSVGGFTEQLAESANNGVRVRLLFGDPDSEAVGRRGDEEGIGTLMAARCQLSWNYLTPLLAQAPVEARRHGTTLYTSLFRFDDVLMANVHTYGCGAGESPVLHLNRIPGGRLFAHYMESFDRVWAAADPA